MTLTGAGWRPSAGGGDVRDRPTPNTAPTTCGWASAGCRLRLETPLGARSLSLPLPGRFNVANALGALAAVHALGEDLDTLVGALERGVRVPGRLEPVDEGQEWAVLVGLCAHAGLAGERAGRCSRTDAAGA